MQFNEMPFEIHRIFPQKTVVASNVILPVLDSSILWLSNKEPKLMCGSFLHWHPAVYQQVLQYGGCCFLTWQRNGSGVFACDRVRSSVTRRHTGCGSCFRHENIYCSLQSDRTLCRWKTFDSLGVLDFRLHCWQNLVRCGRLAVSTLMQQRFLLEMCSKCHRHK